jgi:hypothetical protein
MISMCSKCSRCSSASLCHEITLITKTAKLKVGNLASTTFRFRDHILCIKRERERERERERAQIYTARALLALNYLSWV